MVISLVLVVFLIGRGLADFSQTRSEGSVSTCYVDKFICDRLLVKVIQSRLCISDVVVSSIYFCASWLVWLSVLLLLSSVYMLLRARFSDATADPDLYVD